MRLMRIHFYKRILIMIFFLIGVYILRRILLWSGKDSLDLAMKQGESVSLSDEVTITNSSIFVYRSYLDSRRRLRILAISRCLPENFSITLRMKDESLPVLVVPIGGCPSKWAPGCLYHTYMFEANLPKNLGFERNGVISIGARSTAIEIERTSKRKDGQLTICVPPVYWYTDWTKLIVFIEWWTAQGTKHFFIYFHSASKDVKTVLDFYQSKGLITLIMWPLLPSSSEVDPNKSIYRLSLDLPQTDCVNRIETEFGAMVDIDELILARKTTISWFIRRKFALRPSLGALSFTHHALIFEPNLTPNPFSFDGLDFQGLLRASEFSVEGPHKVIFRAHAVRRISTHYVTDFDSNHWLRKLALEKDAVLLHSRYNYNVDNLQSNHSEINLMQDFVKLENFRRQLVKRKIEIFPSGANLNSSTQEAIGACLLGWRKDHNNCKSPVLGCESVMRGLEEWITAEDDVYSIL